MVDATDTDRPTPAEVSTPAEFVAAMQQLKRWTGMSYRELERRACDLGEILPRTTLTYALTHDRLPHEDLVTAFARACGCDQDEVRIWVAKRKAVAAREPERDGSVVVAASSPATRPPWVWPDRKRAMVGVGVIVAALALAYLLVIVMTLLDPRAKADPPEPTSSRPSPPKIDAQAQSDDPVVVNESMPPPPTDVQLRHPPAAPGSAAKVLYVGDSIGNQTANTLEYYVQNSGKADVVPAVFSGAALCDFLTQKPRRSSVPAKRTLAALVSKIKPRVVVLQFTGESSRKTPCSGGVLRGSPGFYSRYQADARRAVQQITVAAKRAGIDRPKLVWVLQAPDRKAPLVPERLNEDVYEQVADANGDLTVDAGIQLSMLMHGNRKENEGRYTWTPLLMCSENEHKFNYCSDPKAFGGMAIIHPAHNKDLICRNPRRGLICTDRSPGVFRYTWPIARKILEVVA